MGVVAVKDGGPAFPTDEWFDEELIGQYPGMTLRDYFASATLNGMLASPELMQIVTADEMRGSDYIQRLANRSYEIADAMLKAREET